MREAKLPDLIVDARAMLPPEPMERTLEALDQLQPGQEVVLIIPRQPVPLYDVLRNNGYAYRVENGEGDNTGLFLIHIRQMAAPA
ncbi:MAG: DUF2249 domain-containing protein [Rhodocyclaceae bacterium]|nr:DUF2249 domain-containing protein [Rhodocyclaceae bacterium]MCB1964090.1 DUF2249 domain-containing protein [Rhodocyclaceae bacterium]